MANIRGITIKLDADASGIEKALKGVFFIKKNITKVILFFFF